jgi:hypothetical protein
MKLKRINGGRIVNFSIGPFVVVLVILAAIGATAFRVSTGPDRARQRHDTARQVCIDTGGEWLLVDREEICRKAGGLP